VDIRYRYRPGFLFQAIFSPTGDSPRDFAMAVEAVPGELGDREAFPVHTLAELYRAIERWTGRLEEELVARPKNRVLVAQQKAIAYLEKHLPDIPDRALTAEQIREYRRRLERLEAAVLELRAPVGSEDYDQRSLEIREEFDCLRRHIEVLGERSFFHAVLVRLVKYFWDEENLRLVEAGSRAAQQFLGNRHRAPGDRVAAPPVVAWKQ